MSKILACICPLKLFCICTFHKNIEYLFFYCWSLDLLMYCKANIFSHYMFPNIQRWYWLKPPILYIMHQFLYHYTSSRVLVYLRKDATIQ